jgi:hypothetical protein
MPTAAVISNECEKSFPNVTRIRLALPDCIGRGTHWSGRRNLSSCVHRFRFGGNDWKSHQPIHVRALEHHSAASHRHDHLLGLGV